MPTVGNLLQTYIELAEQALKRLAEPSAFREVLKRHAQCPVCLVVLSCYG